MNFQFIKGNWVDLIILVVIIFFISGAFRSGFWVITADFLSFLISLFIALTGYQWAAIVIRSNFTLSHSVSNALGFLFIAIFTEALLGFVFLTAVRKVPFKLWTSRWNNILAILPALGEGLVLVSFILTLVVGLPVSPAIKEDVTDSKIGGYLVGKTTGIEAKVNDIFGGVIEDSLTYLTVHPESTDSLPITVGNRELSIDGVSEREMLDLVNSERNKRDIKSLSWDENLAIVARTHASDMWDRGYFGHISPEGENVGDRLTGAQIEYLLAGENLALAPTLTTAHSGLMNSEGHRKNILETKFSKMGIGVVENDVYGKIFVQVFTN